MYNLKDAEKIHVMMPPPTTFGFFQLNIPEDKIVLCQHLSELLAFETTNTIQSYDAWRRLTHADDLAYVDALHKNAVGEEIYYVSYEARKLCRAGKWRWFGLSGKIIETNKEGTPLRVTGMCADITKTKDTELSTESNKAENNKLDAIFSFFMEHTLTPVAMFDTEMRHKFANAAWIKVWGFDNQNELIGKTHYEVYTKQPASWREQHKRALNGEIVEWSAVELNKYCNEEWYEGITFPWYTSGRSIGGIIIYSTVVTKRIEAENNLKAAIEKLSCSNHALELSNQALAYSNQALDRFAHVCSHDLKEPLRNISNLIQLLFSNNIDCFNEESLLYVRHILKGTDRMNALIKDILSYSEATKHSISKKAHLNLNNIISEIKELFDCRISEMKAQLNIGTLPTILGVASQISQLFTNLIGNAFKFCSEKPLCINICAIDKETFWEFHVCDNGIGIAPEYHTSIFDMFKRLHSKNQYEGSGIGLATCKKIVNDHDGAIYVQSNPEGGSDFVFTLPKMNV